jgi:REP element-mobilizing transposase RayT
MYNPVIHHRRSIRLQGYDYSQSGTCFVTICTHKRKCLFGAILEGKMRLNEMGRIVETVWDELPDHYSHIESDAWIIMPNHVHGIISIRASDPISGTNGVRAGDVRAGDVRAGLKPAPTPPLTNSAHLHGLPEIVRALKTFSSRRINELRNTPGVPLWQRNYWEHIIRTEFELNCLREYIWNNPAQWEMDRMNPAKPDINSDQENGLGNVKTTG